MNPSYNSEDLKDHVGVAVVIEDREGRVLMQDHVKYGFWTLPVGKAKPGQTSIECAKEEVLEECNIVIDDLEELDHNKFNYERAGETVCVEVYIYKPRKITGTVANNEPEKHREQKFLSIDEICKLPYLSDNTLLFLKTLGIDRPARITNS